MAEDGNGARRRIPGPPSPQMPSLDDFPSILLGSEGRKRKNDRKRETNAAKLIKSVSRFVSNQLRSENPPPSSRLHLNELLKSSSGLVYELSGPPVKGGEMLELSSSKNVAALLPLPSHGTQTKDSLVGRLEGLLQEEPSSQELAQVGSQSVRLKRAQSSVSKSLVVGDEKKQHEEGQETMAMQIKQRPTLKMGSHAVAGALAGVFVSLFLHPLDTIKTVIQSKNTGPQSLLPTVASIVSARGLRIRSRQTLDDTFAGVSGLYRGLGSNLASSAPISAIYTFTYESVKATLLPRLPEEYHSLAHCAAGGCASIATSLVYTPSERIKQQMQVGAVYRNSCMAFVGILQKGGLPALYAGWEAVLCRNVPQSVIKFFTYEGLKHWALRGCAPDTNLSNLQTLAIGGLAGSTAALFTTPFDVIKTRLQTQTVGSPHQYTSVLNALRRITAEEGIRSLYRGLIPRLAIYVSQGALFFASYELFKRTLATAAAPQSQKEVEDSPRIGQQRRKPLVNPA